MIPYLCVAAGSALGGMARYGFGLFASRLWGDSFPWGTIAINIAGSFVIGFFGALTTANGALPASPNLRIFVMVGICGGFTTFSSFSLQTFSLARDGSWPGAAANILLSVALCLAAVTAGQLGAERIALLRTAAAVPHSILAILDRPETANPVLTAAALAAARLGSPDIEVLHLRHGALDDFMPTEDVMTAHRQQTIEAAAADKSAALHATFAAWRQHSGIGTWREVHGDAAAAVAAEAAGAALAVIGLIPGSRRGDARQAVHSALFDAKTAALLVPPAVPQSLGQHIAVAWKPSAAADRAIQAALPLLRRAGRVTILIGTPDGAPAAEPGRIRRLLERQRVPVALQPFQTGARQIGEALLDEAHAIGADLLVMGAFSRGQLAEFVLGGATSGILATADLPVFMHH